VADALVSLSHEVLPRWREYERTSTAVIDAYLKPVAARLPAARGECAGGGSANLILRSNGG
jgi:N-methylhydantoinase A